MTELDFIETIRVLMPYVDSKKTTLIDFCGVKIRFDGDNIKIIGKIPYDVVMRIYENYPCDKLGILVGKFGNCISPLEFLTDDIYEKEIKRKNFKESATNRNLKLQIARQQFNMRPKDDKYLPLYRVLTKEGLVVVLSEIKKYYAMIESKFSITEDLDIERKIATINSHIIDRINPRTCIFDWMMQNINAAEFFEGWNRTKNSLSLKEFRRAVEEFDRSVNPFLERDLSTEEIMSDLRKMKISICPFYCSEEYIDKYQYYNVIIRDVETKSEVKFGINPTGFSYTFECTLADKEYLLVQHYFCGSGREENRGEILEIKFFGANCPFKESIRYNISKGIIGDEQKPKEIATDLQIASLYLDLVRATKLSQNVTINNFSKNKTINLQ